MAGLSEELRSAAADVWAAQHRHPFVCGIGDGTLEERGPAGRPGPREFGR
jgi:thiaminase